VETGHSRRALQVAFETDHYQAIPPCFAGVSAQTSIPSMVAGSSVTVVPPYPPAIFNQRHTSAGAGPRQPAGSGQELDQKAAAIRCRIRPPSKQVYWAAEPITRKLARPKTSSNTTITAGPCGRISGSIRFCGSKARTFCAIGLSRSQKATQGEPAACREGSLIHFMATGPRFLACSRPCLGRGFEALRWVDGEEVAEYLLTIAMWFWWTRPSVPSPAPSMRPMQSRSPAAVSASGRELADPRKTGTPEASLMQGA